MVGILLICGKSVFANILKLLRSQSQLFLRSLGKGILSNLSFLYADWNSLESYLLRISAFKQDWNLEYLFKKTNHTKLY